MEPILLPNEKETKVERCESGRILISQTDDSGYETGVFLTPGRAIIIARLITEWAIEQLKNDPSHDPEGERKAKAAERSRRCYNKRKAAQEGGSDVG
jgi:hypothetical protein